VIFGGFCMNVINEVLVYYFAKNKFKVLKLKNKTKPRGRFLHTACIYKKMLKNSKMILFGG